MRTIILLCSTIFLFYSCQQPERKQLTCKKYDANCELGKDYQFVKILSIADSSAVDGFGLPLIVGKWYLRSTKAGTVTPVRTNPTEGFCLNDYELAGIQGKMFDASSDTLIIPIPASKTNVNVRLILLGSQYISVYFDGEKPIQQIMEGK